MPEQYDDMAFLGREAANGFEPDMEAPPWEKLAERLEEEMPAQKKRLWIFWWILPVMLVPMVLQEGKIFQKNTSVAHNEKIDFSSDTALYSQQGEAIASSDTVTLKNGNSAMPAFDLAVKKQKQEKKNARNASFGAAPTAKRKVVSQDGIREKDDRSSGLPTASAPVGSQKQQKEPTRAIKQGSLKNSGESSSKPIEEYTGFTKNDEHNLEEDNTLRLRGTKQSAAASTPNTTVPYTRFTAITIPPYLTQKTLSLKKFDSPGNPSDSSSVFNNKKQTATGSRWEISLVTGADLSSDRLTHTDKAGWNIGLMAGYNLNAQWTLRTGLIRTRKNYTVNGDQYDFKYAAAYPNHRLTMVSGDCEMWEIPLNLRWMARPRSKVSPFVSGGLSTYLMTKERYMYRFTNAYDTLQRNNNYNDIKTYPLGVVHLSAGLQTRINKNISISIEPFAKIPLRGLGSGDLRLMSLGGYGMVHWRF